VSDCDERAGKSDHAPKGMLICGDSVQLILVTTIHFLLDLCFRDF